MKHGGEKTQIAATYAVQNDLCRMRTNPDLLGLHGQVLVAGEAAGVTSVRRCQKLPLSEPMPASSKMDVPLAKSGLVGNEHEASVIT